MNQRSTFIASIEWLLDLGASVMAWIVYVATLAPTITWRNQGADSGDLIAAAYTFGIPHPTGYPFYTLLAGIAAHLPIGDPARNVNFFSVFCAAAAVLLLARTVRAITQDDAAPNIGTRLIAPLSALVLAFAPMFWSQAVIAEVYALHTLLTVGLFAVLFSSFPNRFVVAAAIIGLGLTHHLTILLLVPGALIAVRQRVPRQQMVYAVFALVIPLVLYLYLPIRAMADPPINWGGVTTLERFWWMVSGAPYRAYLSIPSPIDLFARLGNVSRTLFEQFGVWGVALGLWGFAQMGMTPLAHTRRQTSSLVVSLVALVTFVMLYESRDSSVYLLPMLAIFGMGIGYGVHDLSRRFPTRGAQIVLMVALVLFSAYNLVTQWQNLNLSNDREALVYGEKIFGVVPNDAVVIAHGDEHLFALWYYRHVVASASGVSIVSAELLQYEWYIEQINRHLPWTSFSPTTHIANTTYAQRLGQVIDASLKNEHPVYSTRRTTWLDNYGMEEREGLYRISGTRR